MSQQKSVKVPRTPPDYDSQIHGNEYLHQAPETIQDIWFAIARAPEAMKSEFVRKMGHLGLHEENVPSIGTPHTPIEAPLLAEIRKLLREAFERVRMPSKIGSSAPKKIGRPVDPMKAKVVKRLIELRARKNRPTWKNIPDIIYAEFGVRYAQSTLEDYYKKSG